MGDDIRIGMEPPPSPSPRSGKLIGLLAGLVLAVSAAAWLAGALRDPEAPATTTVPVETTSTTAGTGTTATAADRVSRTEAFWTALGRGDAIAAIGVIRQPEPAALDLVGFVAAFSPGFTVEDCRLLATKIVDCLVTVTDREVLDIGAPFAAAERLLAADDGWFDVPSVVAFSAARLSLHALNLHTEEVQAACPLTGAPQVAGLAIIGSPTATCGAYLAGLIPEYLAAQSDATSLP